ncbi:MAG: hypothetical protein WC322_04870 [Candidatus Paceibacterota bacterium]|jgi:hypothetical protein
MAQQNKPTIADQLQALGGTISDLVHAQAHLMVAYDLLIKTLGAKPDVAPGAQVDVKLNCQYCGGERNGKNKRI